MLWSFCSIWCDTDGLSTRTLVHTPEHIHTRRHTRTQQGACPHTLVLLPAAPLSCTCAHVHIHAYTCAHIHIHACTGAHIHIHAYTCAHTHIHAYTCTHTHTSMPMHVHTTVRAHDAWPSSHVPLSNIHMHTCIHTHTAPSPQTPKCTCTYHSARPRCLALLPAAPIKKAALPAAFPTLRGCRCTWHVMMQPGVPMLCAAAPQHSHRT